MMKPLAGGLAYLKAARTVQAPLIRCTCRLTKNNVGHNHLSRRLLSKASSITPSQRREVYASRSSTLQRLLTSRSRPTILYSASPSRTFFLVSYGIGSFCILYGVINIYDMAVHQHDGLWWAVPVMMNAVSLFMLCCGAAALIRARRFVKVIRAVPVETIGGHRDIKIQVEPRQPLSLFTTSQVVECNVQDVTLSRRAHHVLTELRATSQIKNERTQVMTQRKGVLHAFRALASNEGIIKLRIHGVTWRADLGTGKVQDNGQLLDRLFNCSE